MIIKNILYEFIIYMEHKYIKYKTKYLELKNNNLIQTGGDNSKSLNIVILHHPITKSAKLQQDMKPFHTMSVLPIT